MDATAGDGIGGTAGDGDGTFWDPSQCTGTPYCPPRCPRFVDKYGGGLIIRPYTPGDWEPLKEMYRDYGREHRSMGIPPIGEKYITEWLSGLVERGRNFVAVGDDGIVGHIAYAPRDDPEPEIAVFVHQDSHNRGIGTELCRHAIADAADSGHEALVLHVAKENRRAIHVYLGLGFEVVASESMDTKMRLVLDQSVLTETRTTPVHDETTPASSTEF
ncbi:MULTISPECIES: GNAT family N-acetyltransferase [Haloferax]|uniref:GNAT family N-acetyltransferase n=1 Tax=Haloferax marinum TaxID=2666143 RepID=A0A6A8G6U9_9EURY|nr:MULTISPECIES: GNAT family N-acetyltransferase [Haloferax]KAB1197806.1 GNAT family N-acetyltransferase [Haloferax sp. CBA1150]MRW96864.1 GNAT family N-acetyltransferase [Haloferax marinum]